MTIEKYKCPICGNEDPKYIGYRAGHPYCRKCISFRGKEIIGDESYPKKACYHLDYDLSDEQKELSNKLVKNYREGKNTLVHAVCGAGKTEIVLEVIKYAINCGEKVGFAIPRRDVVIEIHQRFASIFKQNSVISVYGGHTDIVQGDLIILTTHQLYRYNHYFDLLIVDEIDAFPFKDNDILEAFFSRATRNHYILMSATPSKNILQTFHQNGNECLELFSRFHTYPLPVPRLIIQKSAFAIIKTISLVEDFVKRNKPIFIFAPTIEDCEGLFQNVNTFIKGGEYVHSKRDNRKEIIENFRNGKYKFLVTTAVLERGVTIKELQVIVYLADHRIYDEHALVQIAGRAGRKKDAPTGEVIFIAHENTESITNAIREIERANKNLQTLFPRN